VLERSRPGDRGAEGEYWGGGWCWSVADMGNTGGAEGEYCGGGRGPLFLINVEMSKKLCRYI